MNSQRAVSTADDEESPAADSDWTFFFLFFSSLVAQMTALMALVLALMLSSAAALAATEFNTCDISEFRCPSKDGQGSICLPMDRWCNGKDDCDNRVDEPRSCSSEYLDPSS